MFAFWLTLMLSVAGCTGTVEVPGSQAAAPLFRPIDAKVAKSFAAKARLTEVETALFRAQVGEISVSRFDQAFDAMFTATVSAPDWPPWQRVDMNHVDGIVQLEEAKADIELGNDAGMPDFVHISYTVCLYENNANVVRCWDSSASQSHKRNVGECLTDMRVCIGRQLEIAVRDAVARMMVQIENDPVIRTWVSQKQTKRKIGLLWWPADPAQSMYSFSKDIDRCLTQHLLKAVPQFTLLQHVTVQDMLYPLMEPGTQPENEHDFAALLRREDVHLRLVDQGIRFLVAFSGSTHSEDWQGGMFCGGGYGGAGCLGFSWADKKTALDAVLWDLADVDRPELAEASESGTSIMPALLLPIPIPASTQSGACRELGRRISTIIQERQGRQEID